MNIPAASGQCPPRGSRHNLQWIFENYERDYNNVYRGLKKAYIAANLERFSQQSKMD
jgi:hypothetical protein